MAFDETKIVGVPTMWQRLFGRPGSDTLFTADAATVEIDIIRDEGERLARLIERGVNSRVLQGLDHKDLGTTKFSPNTRKWPLVEEEGSLSADQLIFRDPGESAFNGKTRIQRMRDRAMRINVESVRRIVRLFEFLAAYSALNGKMPAILGTSDTDMIYDFLRNPTHTFDAAAAWSNQATDITADFDTAWDLIRVDAHMNADFAILGKTAIKSVVNNTQIKDRADNRRFRMAQIGADVQVPPKLTHLVDGGATVRGLLETPEGHEFWLFTNNEFYTDEAGDPQPYIPADKALIGVSNARSDRYFGPPERNPIMPSDQQEYAEMFGFSPTALPMGVNVKGPGAILDPAWFYFDHYVAENKKGLTLRVQTAPIFATTQTDAWVTIGTEGGG
jgi:hypothetical protein